MSESTLIQQEVDALRSLERLAAERSRSERDTERTFRDRKEAETKEYRAAVKHLEAEYQRDTQETQAQYESVRAELLKRFETEHKATANRYAEIRNKMAQKFEEIEESTKQTHEETRWQAQTVFEANKEEAIKRYKQSEAKIAAADGLLAEVQQRSQALLQDCLKYAVEPTAADLQAATAEPAADPIAEYHERLQEAQTLVMPMTEFALPKFLKPEAFFWPFLLVGLVALYPAALLLGWVVGPLAATAGVVVAAVILHRSLTAVARKQVSAAYVTFRQCMARAEALSRQGKEGITASLERQRTEIEERRQRDVKRADDVRVATLAELKRRRDEETRKADEKYPALLAEIKQRRDEELKRVDEKYPRRLAELKQAFERESRALEESHNQEEESRENWYRDTWASLTHRWQEGLTQTETTATEVRQAVDRLSLDWTDHGLERWEPPRAVPRGLRFGEFGVDLGAIPEGVPRDERLASARPTHFSFPALLPFPALGSLLIKAAHDGRVEATKLLQAVMLRFLTSLPPGKVRLTIVDPVGLGENFAAFMHLADYHELLVTSKIWTEAQHIEQRLADLSAHMENVIQKYLRNEFQSIEEYNEFAGEVAEPYRILVVANFPVNFSEAAARRLVNIVTNGAHCGVYTLISVDMKQDLPSGCQLKDLEAHCVNLVWREGQLQWKERDFGQFPLKLDAPPDPETFSQILHKVGALAKDAHRVEVPFEFIAPTPEQYWTFDTRRGVDIPLGRAGAVKLQHLKLGRGTSQHSLIAGKTGSGKSTLLHALITNAALRYSPDELELYLIDFKKGVEFKVYAAYQLPHARVIAVESEREFGLSVLQRLDLELKRRGDRFRELGVQDLNSYREVCSDPLPRVLFIVDEFQEFFVEDDKIAQEVSLLLDRLVRQGRAFGVHVNLGSQSLGGAYSLPRTTLGQMAVRIALQCSESDAHLILSEDNSAARLLTRPGEAIYNDANGMVEGNNYFQVVWLSDERREEYLAKIQELARRDHRPPVDQIVFEGNLPAVPAKNYLLGELLDAPTWPDSLKAFSAWLGEAIAIKDPTCTIFRPQSGSNVLIVGQNEEATLGMMTMAIISLATQHLPPGFGNLGKPASFYIFDGSPVDSPNNGQLARLAGMIPHPLRDVGWRDLTAVLAELNAEVERRQASESSDAPNIYLFVYDLQRFRDLRKSDDDFGFSRHSGDEEKIVKPSQAIVNILRDGPPVGVHTIVWCDSLNNLNRTFERQSMREFEQRVLFQMSANDSSNLVDSPAASRLGEHRALFVSEEEGRMEKFRPYGMPDAEWLAMVQQRLAERRAALGEPPQTPSQRATDGASQPKNGPVAPEDGEERTPEVSKGRWAEID